MGFSSLLDPQQTLNSWQPQARCRTRQLIAGMPRLDEREEQGALMAAVAERHDRAAFASLFDHYAPRLKAFLMRQGVPASAAEELVQETMLTVWRRAETFDPRQAAVATWIFTIARNKRIDRLRRENKPELDPHEPLFHPEVQAADDAVDQRQQGERLRRAIADLPKEQADLVRMAYFGDKVHTTIAEETGIALGTVKSRLRLAMKRLRRALEEEN